ncbi:arginine deiminase family protein [Paenibacillus macquariensis]|uniref:Arginine deiminase n=1 Tax=Paenibacillus macquariensis TaxID=948756 RepID=A0ABY1K2H3_9BACL|nr:arginine deiminase family protein [Paenibacillus macquariensis]MEC0090189.1 arginine deiminase family protein [Paenibacillus macquariensis]OAB39563.1 hypothetical protein PMSM_00050 [Paenibacillus macquariensis subsp. macquariensis]SIR17029.1 arginine deiminase [Paenibacillus macquariensis]
MKLHCFSEYDRLRTVALCRPSLVQVQTRNEAEYVCFREPVDPQIAVEAHQRLRESLESNGVHTIDFTSYFEDEERALSDQLVNRTYSRDVAGVIGNALLFGSAGVDVRKPDFQLAHSALRKAVGTSVISEVTSSIQSSLEFGDFLMLNRSAILINLGWRTSLDGVMNIKNLIFKSGFEQIGLISLPPDLTLPHLDVVCNVVGSHLFLASKFLRHVPVRIIMQDKEERYEMLPDFVARHGYHVRYLPENHDPLAYTNFINIDRSTVLASESAVAIRDILADVQVDVQTVDITELEKGGGGIRCLTLPLCRDDENTLSDSKVTSIVS